MNKEEIKQYLRNQIDSCIKINHQFYQNMFYLCYNKNYVRSLKLSKITGKPVNKKDFNGGQELFWINTSYKDFSYSQPIRDYLIEKYSKEVDEQKQIIEEVLNEYEEYKDYKIW